MQQEKNPFQISLVLSNVFSYCGLEELKRCRLVCHLWKEECQPYIRRRAKTNFNSDDLTRKRKFTMLMKNADYLPMSSFHFVGKRAVDQVEQFSQDFDPSVNNLRLNCLNTEVEPIYLFSLFGKFSNLKKLELKRLPPSFHTTERIFSTEAEITLLQTVEKVTLAQECSLGITLDLLKMCPNMDTFKFGSFNNVSNQIKALKSLDSSRHSKIKKIKIKRVDFEFETALEIFSLLTQSKFELQKLMFSHCAVKEDPNNQLGELISQLLQQQSATLQKLELPSAPFWALGNSSGSLAITFPQMDTLKRIIYPDFTFHYSFPSISNYFPNLRVLDLKNVKIYSIILIEEFPLNRDNNINVPTNSPFNLHRLLLPDNLKPCQHDFVVSLARVFPLVENITLLYEEPDILEYIWESWPNVIGLDISGNNCFINPNIPNYYEHNAIYLGLDRNDFNIESQVIQEDYRRPDFTVNFTKPSIRNLKELRTLKISSAGLTDITFYWGISELHKLIHLELKCPNITQQCLDDLVQKLPSLISWSNDNHEDGIKSFHTDFAIVFSF